jgi:hypothetical protein
MKPFSRSFLHLVVALLVSFAAIAQDKKSDAAAAVPSGEKLPTADEIVKRFVQAIGGTEAYAKVKSHQSKGKIEMPAQQMSGDVEILAGHPNKLLVKIKLGAAGEIATGYDGKVAWMTSPFTGPMLLEGKQLSQIATQADFDHLLHNADDYKKIEVLGSAMFEGEDCYKVRFVDKTDIETTEYFSKKTGLQKGFIGTQESPFGPVTATTVIQEYKKFGDLNLPAKVTQKMSGMQNITTITEMTFNQVPEGTFALPADIAALTKK